MRKIVAESSNEVETFQFKLKTIKDRLKDSFLAFVNAPDPPLNRLGYIIYGGPEQIHARAFENFAAFCVGGSTADIKEVDDYLNFFAHEVHKEWSKGDFHGLQAAKYLRQVLRLTHTHPADLDMIATELILIDYYGGTGHAVRFDGDQEDFKLGGDRFVVWVGTHSPTIRKAVTQIIDRELAGNTARDEQFILAQRRLQAKYPRIKNMVVTSVNQAVTA